MGGAGCLAKLSMKPKLRYWIVARTTADRPSEPAFLALKVMVANIAVARTLSRGRLDFCMLSTPTKGLI